MAGCRAKYENDAKIQKIARNNTKYNGIIKNKIKCRTRINDKET